MIIRAFIHLCTLLLTFSTSIAASSVSLYAATNHLPVFPAGIPDVIEINNKTKAAAARLAVLAYEGAGNLDVAKALIYQKLKSMDADHGGPFELLWGPAQNNGVSGFLAKAADGTYALAFRGSLTNDTDAVGYVQNWADNLAGLILVPWGYPMGKGPWRLPQLSAGMNDGLALAASMTDPDTGYSLIDQLRDTMNKAPAPMLIAGHSSGGALATLATVWLRDQLPRAGGPPKKNLVFTPFTFAAPTVTNDVFATLFYSSCPFSYRAVNTYDIVPMAWHNLTGVLSGFPPPGQSVYEYSKTLWLLIQAAKYNSGSLTLVPVGATADHFAGPMPLSQDFVSEAQRQHSMHDIYYKYVKGTL